MYVRPISQGSIATIAYTGELRRSLTQDKLIDCQTRVQNHVPVHQTYAEIRSVQGPLLIHMTFAFRTFELYEHAAHLLLPAINLI